MSSSSRLIPIKHCTRIRQPYLPNATEEIIHRKTNIQLFLCEDHIQFLLRDAFMFCAVLFDQRLASFRLTLLNDFAAVVDLTCPRVG